MRDYAKVSPQFWIGETGKRLRSAGAECQMVALYLLTSPHANMIGMYYLPKMYIAHECGLSLEGASKALQRASEGGFCGYCEDTEIVWVYEMAKYQIGDHLKEGDNRVKGVQKIYDEQPSNPFLEPFFEKYRDAFFLKPYRGKGSPFEAPSKPLRSQEQEQDQEQEQKTLPPPKNLAPQNLGQDEAENCNADCSEIAIPEDKKKETALQAVCRETWDAYSNAYFDRYGTAPLRNAKVNSQIKSFCQKIPLDEAPAVAAFFVRHDDAFYTRKAHDVGLMLADAAKLRMEWKTGKRVNEHIAKPLAADQGARVTKPADLWWASEHGVIAKGKELGIAPRPGETMNEFKGRINVKMYELKNEQEQQKSAVS